MAAKLNQIIAIEKGVKSSSFQELTEAHHLLQKPSLLAGLSRTYQPKDEAGEQFPPKFTRVQASTGVDAGPTTRALLLSAQVAKHLPCLWYTSRVSTS